jgi:hypothetical protein
MLEELQRRNYVKNTICYYLKAVERFANAMRLIERFTAWQLLLEAMLADIIDDTS